MAKISAERCCDLLGGALERVPTPETWFTEAGIQWFPDVAGTVFAHSEVLAMQFQVMLGEVTRAEGIYESSASNARRLFIQKARALYRSLMLETNAFPAVEVPRGNPHQYFEEIRGFVSQAGHQIFFADRYLDADFAGIYLPQIRPEIAIRLMTSHRSAASLVPAVQLFSQQEPRNIEIRSLDANDIHDRQLIVDGQYLYQSGASFKDGGRLSPSTINQIVDGAAALIAARETDWVTAQVHI